MMRSIHAQSLTPKDQHTIEPSNPPNQLQDPKKNTEGKVENPPEIK